MVHQQWRRPCRLCSLSGRTSASSSPLPAPRRMGPDGQLHETRMGNCALAVVEATVHPPRGGNALADGSHSNTLLPIFVDGIIRIIIIFQCLKLCHFEQALHFNCAFVFGGEHILQTRATATEKIQPILYGPILPAAISPVSVLNQMSPKGTASLYFICQCGSGHFKLRNIIRSS